MVSFIVPAYNCEKYIKKCIESILHQDYPSFEIIIINDGSKDNTSSILNEYTNLDSRIKVFNVDNGGPSKARNIGLDNALGDWIIFVDSDDWVDKDIITKLELNNTNTPDIIFWGFKRCFDNNKIEVCEPKKFSIAYDSIDINNQLLYLLISDEEYFGYSVNKIYKRSIINKYHIRFNDALSIREDELFALTYCYHIKSIKIINYTPYNYRIIKNSLSHSTNFIFKNYFLLAQQEEIILSNLKASSFKDALAIKIFKYYIESIVECLSLMSNKTEQIIQSTCSFYDKYISSLNIPIWQTVIFNFPIRTLRNKLVLYVFKIRFKIKK